MDARKQRYKKNILFYKYYVLFSGALFIWPIEVLFFQNRGMRYVDIMIVESVISIAQLIMEVPSGIVADKIGYRRSVLIGIAAEIVAICILVGNTELVAAYIYAIIFGMGLALISGADTALLYESHVGLNQENSYIQTVRRAGMLKMWGLAVVSVVSGVLFKWNPRYPYMFSILFLFVAFGIVFQFNEVTTYDNRNQNNVDVMSIKQTFWKNHKIRWIVLIAILFHFLFSDMNYFMQAYMVKLEVDIDYYGVIFCVCNIFSAISFILSGRIEKQLKENTRLVMAILITIIFWSASLFQSYFMLVLLCLTRICVATVMPILNATINRSISSVSRATLLSVYNAIISVFMIIYDPVIGKVLDVWSIQGGYFIVGVLGIVLSVLLVVDKLQMSK